MKLSVSHCFSIYLFIYLFGAANFMHNINIIYLFHAYCQHKKSYRNTIQVVKNCLNTH